MKLKLSSKTPGADTENRRAPAAKERPAPALLLDTLRRWAEEIKRGIDTEVTIEDTLPRETAIEVPEERFAYLLTLIYRFLSLSPRLDDPAVRADAHGEGVSITVTAKKNENRRLSEREALGISDHYLRVIAGDLSACGANWYFDETKDRFSVVITLARSKADVSRLLAPVPDTIARAVASALRDAERILRLSRN